MIDFKNINLSFEDKTIFHDFQLHIDEGEKVLITGRSGVGKSVLLRLLLGFETPDLGDIFIHGQSIYAVSFYETRQQFAYVNQDVSIRFGKVEDVLLDIAKFSGNRFNGQIDSEIAEYFEFDLTLLQKKTESLSGGERQRLGIILAIMLNRPIFLLDEVTSALDEHLKQKTVSYFANSKHTVIAISHDSVWFDNPQFRKVAL